MDFQTLGSKCSFEQCQLHDFLPFECDLCKKKFCNEHRLYEAHECPNAYMKSSTVPICPICGQPVPVKPGEDANLTMSRHIDQLCPKQKKRDLKACALASCNTKDIVLVRCQTCGQKFCMRHRLEADHSCLPVAAHVASGTGTIKGTKPRFFDQQSAKQSSSNDRKHSSSSAKKSHKPASLRPSNGVKTPIVLGRKKPGEGDIVVLVHFPYSSGQQSAYFSICERWSAGKVVDGLAKHANLALRDDDGNRLQAYSTANSKALPNITDFRQLLRDGMVVSEGAIVLEWAGPTLTAEWEEKLMALYNNQNPIASFFGGGKNPTNAAPTTPNGSNEQRTTNVATGASSGKQSSEARSAAVAAAQSRAKSSAAGKPNKGTAQQQPTQRRSSQSANRRGSSAKEESCLVM
eukprot:Rmarinus@m.4474